MLPDSIPASVPQVLINREPLKNLHFDVELLGDCDAIVNELCHRLGEGWREELCTLPKCAEIQRDELPTPLLLSPAPSPAPHKMKAGETADETNNGNVSTSETTNESSEKMTKEASDSTNSGQMIADETTPETGRDKIVMAQTADETETENKDSRKTTDKTVSSEGDAVSTSQDICNTKHSSNSSETNNVEAENANHTKEFRSNMDHGKMENQTEENISTSQDENKDTRPSSDTGVSSTSENNGRDDEEENEEPLPGEDLPFTRRPRRVNLGAQIKGLLMFCMSHNFGFCRTRPV